MGRSSTASVIVRLALIAASAFATSTSVAAGSSEHDDHADNTDNSNSASADSATEIPAKESAKASTKEASVTAKAAVTAPAASPGAVSSEQSMKWLMNGNARYVKRNFRKDGRDPEDRKRFISKEKPHAIVLASSDSRVPTEIVFDQGIGEIYVVRVMGVALDSSVVASLEYAVEHLGTKLLVVMGNSQCPAVRAAINLKEGETAGSDALDRVIADIRPRLKSVIKDGPSPNLEVEAAVNADGVARELVKRSELIKRKVDAGELTIKSALYRVDSGKVSFY